MAVEIASGLYGVAARARAAAYDAGLLPTRRVEGLGVVSVGGLSSSADGKTPLAMHVAAALAARGRAVALVCRGYRGRWERDGGLVSDGARLHATAREAGDEAVLAARRLPDVAVLVGADRHRAARRARALGAEVVVLDSGFQHRKLARDLDVLCLSPDRLEAKEALLPAGSLREPLEAAARAHLLAYHGALRPGERLPARALAFRLVPRCLVDPAFDERGPATALAGRRVLALAGIGRPERLVATLRELGAEVAGTLFPGDHHAYDAADGARVVARARLAGADLVVTTEKDLVRLPPLDATVRALRVDVAIDRGAPLLERSLELL